MNSLINNPRELYFEWRMLIAGDRKYSLIYQLIILKSQIKRILNGKSPSERLITKDTELVIDGFQGSANSFATATFKNSQTKSVKLAHHLHSPAQIIEAINQDIPIILFIREPIGAILSLTSRWSYISVNSGLKSYIDFYSKLEPFTDKYIVSNFEQTTQYFDLIVQKTNRKFLTSFDLVNMTQAKEQHMPSQTKRKKRKQLKQQKKQEFTWEINSKLLKEAQNIYKKFELLSLKN